MRCTRPRRSATRPSAPQSATRPDAYRGESAGSAPASVRDSRQRRAPVAPCRTRLWRERISRAHLMPTYDNVTTALKTKWMLPSAGQPPSTSRHTRWHRRAGAAAHAERGRWNGSVLGVLSGRSGTPGNLRNSLGIDWMSPRRRGKSPDPEDRVRERTRRKP